MDKKIFWGEKKNHVIGIKPEQCQPAFRNFTYLILLVSHKCQCTWMPQWAAMKLAEKQTTDSEHLKEGMERCMPAPGECSESLPVSEPAGMQLDGISSQFQLCFNPHSSMAQISRSFNTVTDLRVRKRLIFLIVVGAFLPSLMFQKTESILWF